MDIFILLLISLFVYLIPKTDVDYLSNKSTKSLKGLLALLIIFHHISQKVTTGENFSNFEYMGRYIVALFFFLSGYGLYFQYSNNANYMKNFLRKRLVRIFIPFYVFIVIYVIYRATLGEVINVDFFLSFWKDHNNIIYNGWFINSIIVLYVIFYISFVRNNSKTSFYTLTVLTLVYIFWKVYQDHGDWEYVSMMAFLLGIFWMKNRVSIDKIIEKNYFISLVLFSVLMYIFRHYEVIMENIGIKNKYVYYANDMNNEIHIDKVKEKFKDKILTTSLIEETLNWLVPISKKWRDICKALFDENKNSAGWLHGVYPSLSARPFNAYNEK